MKKGRNKTYSKKRFRPRLSSFIKHLKVSKYTSRLPGQSRSAHRGGYPKFAYLKALLLKAFLQLTYRDLEAFLRRYPSYATACGFHRGHIPHYFRFAKFFTNLDPSLVEDISVDVTRKVIRRLRMPCKFLGVDSTGVRAYVNSFSKKGDPDAKVGRSSVKGFFYGYKIHLVVDGQTDLPVAFEVTAGNVYDGHRLLPLLRKAVKITRKRPKAAIADKGYDAGYNYMGVVDEFGAAPIISIRGRRRVVLGRQTTLTDFFPQKRGKRRKKGKRRTKTQEQLLRHCPPIARGSPEWKFLAKFRASAERAISRLKAIFGLERVRVRGLERVKKHISLCVIGLLESALYLCKRGRPRLARSFPYVV